MHETYIHHPTFGLLYSLCSIGETQGLFTTLYAQRLFFRATIDPSPREQAIFEPISRSEARQIIEETLRDLRRTGANERFSTLQQVYRSTFM
nr:PipX family protein [Synechococcus sp. PCC 7336]